MNSCLSKLCEKLILTRIKNHLKINNIIIKQQSGFRQHRQTKDNLLFLIQKIQETLTRKKKVISFFFDISQAFDKIWHDGLIFKLIQTKLPFYLIKWIQFYLQDRLFCVKIGSYTSEFKRIECGVPQGAVLSPVLFCIYINDIPAVFIKNKSYSLLFADDLVSFFIFKKANNINIQIKNYLQLLENWLDNWRLTMHPTKCNFMTFNNNSNKSLNEKFNHKLYNERIPACNSLKFLGITFDLGLKFNNHTKDIKKRCINRLNIIKILSNKRWKLTTTTLKSIYLSLIRSEIDYSSLIMPFLSKSLAKTIQATQNTALRSIYKLNYRTSTEEVTRISNIVTIKTRADTLNKNYIQNCIINRNPLILDLINEYKSGGKNFKNKTFLCTQIASLPNVVTINFPQS